VKLAQAVRNGCELLRAYAYAGHLQPLKARAAADKAAGIWSYSKPAWRMLCCCKFQRMQVRQLPTSRECVLPDICWEPAAAKVEVL
jgi:hypothetical protein